MIASMMNMRYGTFKFQRIRDLRIDKGYKQREIANILHVKQNTYCQYETGKCAYPVQVLITLAQFYHTSVDYLLGLTDEPIPYPPAK